MITFKQKIPKDVDATIFLIDKKHVAGFNSSDWPQISEIISSGQFAAKLNDIFPIVSNNKIALLVGLGDKSKLSSTKLRTVIKKALESKFLKELMKIMIIPHSQKEEAIIALIEGIKIGTYKWQKYFSSKPKKGPAEKEIMIVTPKKKVYENACLICDGVNFTRDLVNDNADFVTSQHFEKVVKELVKDNKRVQLEILNKKELKAKGLNLHLAVNQGSKNEPKLIIIKYTGNAKDKKTTAIIGKGITFDTGGLNLKPTSYIECMRYDMGGAGSVLGIMKNVIHLKLKKNVIGVLGVAENAIGSGAYKPGDVIKSYSGKTVEILNTDAEGRLVLADAISYIVKNYKPTRIIDIATLTGACVVALGYDYTGLVSTHNQFAKELLSSADKTDDRAWRLPIYEEIQDALKSKIADMKNLGLSKGAAGTITAAEFLRRFNEDIEWAHFDIAGTAFVDGSERMYFNHGATGSSVRLLTHYIQNYS